MLYKITFFHVTKSGKNWGAGRIPLLGYSISPLEKLIPFRTCLINYELRFYKVEGRRKKVELIRNIISFCQMNPEGVTS